MASTITNVDQFIGDLNTPLFHTKTVSFLKFYLEKGFGFGFIAHQNRFTKQRWLDTIYEATDFYVVNDVCEEMYDVLFDTGEYESIYDMFNITLRKMFGGMFGMNCDYWADLGVDNDTAYKLFNFENIPAFQKIQVFMCCEMFYGLYGFDIMRRMSHYTAMPDDLYTTISMGEFTPYYLGAINQCIEDTPELFVFTIVNIFIHAFKYIKTTRKDKYLRKDPMLNYPLWQSYYGQLYQEDNLHFTRPATQHMVCHYDKKHMETLIPRWLKEELEC